MLVSIVDCGVHPVARPKYKRNAGPSKHLRPVLEKRVEIEKRAEVALFDKGQPVDGKGKGAPFGGTYHPPPSICPFTVHTPSSITSHPLSTRPSALTNIPQAAQTKRSTSKTQTTLAGKAQTTA